MSAELIVIWWRDIPAQVMASRGRDRARAQLSDRFQEAIDTAATREGLIGTDDYMSEWHKDVRPCGEDLKTEAMAEADRLELEFTDDLLDGLSKSGGVRGAS